MFDEHYNEHVKHKIRIMRVKNVPNGKNNQLAPLTRSKEHINGVSKIVEMEEPSKIISIDGVSV